MPILQAVELSHSYGSYQALAPVDLELNAGEISVVEGPNGSGKSTLLLCLSGLLRPTTGRITVDGHDLYSDEPAAKRGLAFVPDVPRFYIELTAWEHLRFLALAHDAAEGFDERAERLLKEFGLWESRDLFPHHFSRGMSLKLGLVFALIRPFKVLLLDEPTSALDTDTSPLFVRRLLELRDQGASLLVSSHDPDLKGLIANRIFSMQQGRLQAV